MTTRASLETKMKYVNQMIGPNPKSALQLERECGKQFTQTTFLRWKKELAPKPKGSLPVGERPVEKFTEVDKYNFVMEVMGLEEIEVEKRLNSKGISREMLDDWKREFLLSLVKPKVLVKENDSIQTLQKENEILKAKLERAERDKHLIEQVLVTRLQQTVNY